MPAPPRRRWRGGVVYFGSEGGNVYAFDLAGGAAATARPAISKLHPNYSLHPQRTALARGA